MSNWTSPMGRLRTGPEKGRDWLAGRCTCRTCRLYAREHYPEDYARRLVELGEPVPDELAAAIVEQRKAWRPGWAIVGVDLGKRTDHSAIALLLPTGPDDPARWGIPSVTRLPLASGAGERHYLGQAGRVATVAEQLLTQVRGEVAIAVDATGVGDAVIEMVKDKLPTSPRVRLIRAILRGGRDSTVQHLRWSISKIALIDPIVAALEQGEVKFGPSFRDRELVQRELLAFRAKAAASVGTPDRLEADKQGDHDDTVIAVALAVFGARIRERQGITIHTPTSLPRLDQTTPLYVRGPSTTAARRIPNRPY